MSLSDLHTCSPQGILLRPARQSVSAFKGPLRQSARSKGLACRADRKMSSGDELKCRSSSAQAEGFPEDLSRRGILAAFPMLMLATSAAPSHADTLSAYQDNVDSFQVSIPDGWIAAQGSSGGNRAFGGAAGTRRALAWYPETGTDTNVTVIITNAGADYTSLGSFGNAEQFGENLVASLDRSFLLRSGFNRPKTVQRAKLLDAKANKGMYMLEYTVQKPEEQEPRHFLSAISLGYNGRYNRLYTLTAQTKEGDFQGTKGTLRQVLGSFKPPAPVV